ncbi:hypothetical protein HanIR_Chr03g0147901 [Helianthus annuus]|nr:hypothetical protein HanIR_Chr03g0147901 [Helianthus annuus]
MASPSLSSPTFPSPISISHFANSLIDFIFELSAPIVRRMFLVSRKSLHFAHMYEELKDALTISCLVPLGITGSICLKSPPNTITLPPKGISERILLPSENTSVMVLSKASNACLCTIGASSHIINWVSFNNLAISLFGLILHIESSVRLMGIWNRE